MEVSLFYKGDHNLIYLIINNLVVRSKKSINVLQWNQQVAQSINKAKRKAKKLGVAESTVKGWHFCRVFYRF